MRGPTVDVVPVGRTPSVALAFPRAHPLTAFHPLAQPTRFIHHTNIIIGVRIGESTRLLLPIASVDTKTCVLRLDVGTPGADLSVVLVYAGGGVVALSLGGDCGADRRTRH